MEATVESAVDRTYVRALVAIVSFDCVYNVPIAYCTYCNDIRIIHLLLLLFVLGDGSLRCRLAQPGVKGVLCSDAQGLCLSGT